MLKKMLAVLLGALLVFGAVFAWKWHQGRKAGAAASAASAQGRLVTVSSTTASNEVWHPTLQAVATLRAIQGIDVSPEVAGVVKEIHFESGERVERGDLLVRLDAAAEEALLKGYEAQASQATLHLHRIQELSRTQVTPAADLDQARADHEQALANVESEQAAISKKTIRAAFSGVAGIRQVDLGQYLSPGAAIVTLQSLDPIYVDFSLPQENFSQVRTGQTLRVTLDAYPGDPFTGAITAINPKISALTRSFAIRGTLSNAELRLRPGMFGTVAVELPEQTCVITVPKSAITYNPYGDSVFLIQTNEDGDRKGPRLKVRRVFVQAGEPRGTQVAIEKGVPAGQSVVTSGQMKLEDGVAVRINNSIQPLNQPSVTPPDE